MAGWEALGNEAIIAMVGHESFARALVLVRSGQVRDVEWSADALTVSGRVSGTYRDDYAVTVYLATSLSGSISVYRSQCTCPIRQDCKHAAAVLLVARHLSGISQLARPEWEKVLDKLLAGAPPPTELAPLALEFGVERIPATRGYGGRQELQIRPVRQGKSGSWVRSGIGWDDLDYVARSYRPAHRELLLQFRAATGASARYALPRTPWLTLSGVSSGFWGLLEQTVELGLPLLTAKPLRGPTCLPAPAAAELDLQQSADGDVELSARIRLGAEVFGPDRAGVLGEPAHGVFGVAGGEDGELLLGRLAAPLSAELRRLLVAGRSLRIPRGDRERFVAGFLPELRRTVNVVSSDESVDLPEYVAPVLGLQLEYLPEHLLRLEWRAHYGQAGGRRSFRLDESGELLSGRDRAEERRQLAALSLPLDRLPALARPGGGEPVARATLDTAAALIFLDEVLPKIEAAGVEVTRVGRVLDYRPAGPPQISAVAQPRPAAPGRPADWFDLHFNVVLDGEEISFADVFAALTRGDEMLVLDTGVYLMLDRPELDQLRALIEESQALHDGEPRPTLPVSSAQASVWDDLIELGVSIDQSSRWAAAVRGLAASATGPPEETAIPVPGGLHAELRPYQLAGFRWLVARWSQRLGGILADDMGLGKTLQALALLCHARVAEPDAPPFLVVAPTSVIGNWVSEAARFAPGLRVVSRHGSRRRAALGDPAAGADVVITSYALLRLDAEELTATPWSGVILDEAQFLKNAQAKTYSAARRLDAPFKLAITGTPLENSLMDLWSLLSITAPGLFPHAERFSTFYRRPIERTGDPARLAQLRRRVAPLLLRRTKDSVAAELPAKQEQVVTVELHARHRRIYQTHLQRERQRVLGLIDDLDRNRFTILRSLTLLRRLSLDAALIDEAYAAVPSVKIELLLTDLAEIVGEGHRALVFSQFTSFLGRIRSRLDEAGIEYAYLDGRTRNRERVVQRFRDGDARVFLISLKAGGFGLNLSEADYVFVLDPWWNPATEAQAVDRAHRIGQSRTVMVYRMVAADTIEQKVMDLKAAKEQLFDAVVGGDALAGAALTAEQIQALLDG